MAGLNGHEILNVLGRDNLGRPAGPQLQTTTGDIAALGGGAAAGPVTPVDSGTSYITDISDTFIVWDSVTSGAKNTFITTSGLANGQVLVIKDYGAGDFTQTLQAFEGGVTIEKATSYVLAPSNGASVNLKWDGVSNLLIW